MAQGTVETIQVTPWFDMELFMLTSQETRIGGQMMEKVMSRFEQWAGLLKAHKLQRDNKGYLLVHLPEQVEKEIDTVWQNSPSEAFQLNALAQTLCMSVVHDLVPEVQDAGCAPAPAPYVELEELLQHARVPYAADGPVLSRRFAVLTHMPFKGGCETCALIKDCPKGQGCGSDSMSVVLPGHENR